MRKIHKANTTANNYNNYKHEYETIKANNTAR